MAAYCFLLIAYLVLRFKSLEYAGNVMMTMILGFGPMMILSVIFIPWLNAIIKNPVFRFLGNISWEVYLLHFPVQCAIRIVDVYMNLNLNYSSRWVWGGYVAVTLTISMLYRYFLAKKTENYIIDFFKKDKKESEVLRY